MPPPITIFLSSFAVFLFFLTPTVNTGDGGEFATVAYYLGVAHPSGYPLYLSIAKAVTFLPLGNMAFRVALLSALFGSLSLTLLFWLIRRLTSSSIAALFCGTVLFTSYSFFSQSVIAKFYTLNLFLILSGFALYVAWGRSGLTPLIAKEGRSGYLYILSFLVGLSLTNHHTGIIVAGPILLGLFLQRSFLFRPGTILACAVLFFMGFVLNAYLVIRGNFGNFFSSVYIDSLQSFYEVITRQAYKESGTLSIIQNSGSDILAYWYGLRHLLEVLAKNFSLYSFPLFLLGSFYLLRKNWRLFAVAVTSLVLYGPFIARMTMGSEDVSETSYYISANQYFLPAMAFYVFFLGLGFHQIILWLGRTRLSLVYRVLPIVMALFPLVFFVSRATDSNYRTNHVAYQVTKDMYSVLPVRSIMLTFGDNASYQGWYLKVLGRYREDIGQISSPQQETILWDYQGCSKGFYGDIFPMVYTRKFRELVPLMLRGRFYGTEPVKPGQAYEGYIRSTPFSLAYLYLPMDKYIEDKTFRQKDISRYIGDRMLTADRIISIVPCISHFTDDLFTRRLCSHYSIHLNGMARLFSGEEWDRTGETMEVRMTDGDKGTVQNVYYIDITQKNEPYLALSSQIQEFNQWKILYLRK